MMIYQTIPLFALFSVAATVSAASDYEYTDHDGTVSNLRGVDGQQQRQTTGNLPLYEYQLTLNATTPYTTAYERCAGWPDYVNPNEFTWFGLRVQLPDDAATSSGMYSTNVAQYNEALGVVQVYGETTPRTLLNYTFTSTEPSPIVKLNLNNDVLWTSYQYSFPDEVTEVAQEKKYAIMCTVSVEPKSTSGGGWVGTAGVDATLTITLKQSLVSSPPATSPPTSGGTTIFGMPMTSLVLTALLGISALFV